jgi:hypothetical protein
MTVVEKSCQAAEIVTGQEQNKVLRELHEKIQQNEAVEDALWQTVLAFQNYPFRTSSGLPFSYIVKRGRNGNYTGELVISRKEGSKTLTRSSILLAFRKVLKAMELGEAVGADGNGEARISLPEYKGPKAIGQIFGISYVYSMFWRWGLIAVPENVAEKLRGEGVR